ncbi:MAG: diguanylate cyclase [Acidobacteriota bacterium]
MKLSGLSEYRTWSRALWSVLLLAAASAVAGAAVMAAQYQFSKLTVLLSGIFICALLSQYELRLPKTQIEVSVGDVIAIWGVFWLGLSGGVLLGAAASISRLARERRLNASGLLNIALSIISISSAALLFSVAYPGQTTVDEWSGLQDNNLILAGTVLMTTVSFTLYNVLDLTFRLVDGSVLMRFGRTLWRRTLQVPATVVGATVLCVLFAKFGISFGLVVVPLAVFAIMAYRIHLKRLEQKTSEILEASRVHLATVEALATAIDARDQVGHGHVRRTPIYAVGLGQALGLSEDEINALRAGALLHDIGKLAVPDHILSKTGPLTPAELEKTKIHSSVGAAILARVGFQYPVVPTVKHHHERWDGKGYPDGLAGEEIPLTARILAIADTFDTLRSDRAFRSAMSRTTAREHMQQRVGSQFDPKLVGVFLKKLNSFEEEVDRQGLSYDETASASSRSAEDGQSNYVDQIKLANKEVFTLFELAREFGSSENLGQMLSLFTAKISELVPFETCVVYLLDTTRRYANAAHVQGENCELLNGRRIKVGEGATGVVLKKREMIKNVNPDLDFSLSHLELTQQYATMASLPLMVDDEIIGAVSIYSHELAAYGDEHVRLLETVSHIAAEAIAKTQQHAETKAHALTDTMTGLPNARSLQMHFEKEIGRAARTGSSIQVLVMDLDGFKAVNDTFGHKVGDEMLREVGKVIGEQLRDYDFLSRYGGDEFVAVIPEADHDMVADLCARIEKAVCEFRLPIVDADRFASVGVSLGSASYPQAGDTFDQMIVAADKAMYQRKTSRKRKDPITGGDPTVPLSEVLASIIETPQDAFEISANEGFIVELDESHVIMTSSIQ